MSWKTGTIWKLSILSENKPEEKILWNFWAFGLVYDQQGPDASFAGLVKTLRLLFCFFFSFWLSSVVVDFLSLLLLRPFFLFFQIANRASTVGGTWSYRTTNMLLLCVLNFIGTRRIANSSIPTEPWELLPEWGKRKRNWLFSFKYFQQLRSETLQMPYELRDWNSKREVAHEELLKLNKILTRKVVAAGNCSGWVLLAEVNAPLKRCWKKFQKLFEWSQIIKLTSLHRNSEVKANCYNSLQQGKETDWLVGVTPRVLGPWEPKIRPKMFSWTGFSEPWRETHISIVSLHSSSPISLWSPIM